jgi:hypothetical protein
MAQETRQGKIRQDIRKTRHEARQNMIRPDERIQEIRRHDKIEDVRKDNLWKCSPPFSRQDNI